MCRVGSADWAVRPATAADADEIGALHVRSWRYGYRGLVPDDVLAALDAAERAQRWRETLAGPGASAVFLAVRVGSACSELGAFCAVGPARDDGAEECGAEKCKGELYALYAEPSAFGHGAASAAHQAGLDYLRAAGFRHLVLWVLKNNDRARAFYSRHGWRSDELLDQYQYRGAEMTVLRYSCVLR